MYSRVEGCIEQMHNGVLHLVHEALPRQFSGKFSGPCAVQATEIAFVK